MRLELYLTSEGKYTTSNGTGSGKESVLIDCTERPLEIEPKVEIRAFYYRYFFESTLNLL